MNRFSIIVVALIALVLSGCEAQPDDSPITPSPDQLTFLYFYTDG